MYLGIDLGTSGVKALLIDAGQKVHGSATAPLSVSRPEVGWSEQSPADWIAATEAVLQDLGADHDLSAVKAVGLSGQMHGATLLDASDSVLRSAILWNDTRSHAEAAVLDADPRFRNITGNIVFPGFTAPKLFWVRLHEPEVFARIARVLLPKDYLRLWLTGEAVSDMSDSAGTSWLDTGARAWSDDLLAATEMSRDQMPALVEGSAVSGGLRDSIASRFGLPRGIPVAGGAGDNAASAIGMGVVDAGSAFLSLGTSGVLFMVSDGYAPSPDSALHAFCHALPGRWHNMGVMLAAADALSWYARLVGAAPEALTARLGDLQAPGRTLFLPYLGGERTPHNDARVRGAFIGLQHETDRDAGTRAVLESVAFAFRDSLEAMKAAGAAPSRVFAVGGGAASDYWLSAISTVLGLPVIRPEKGDYGAAFGAARLAIMAAGDGDESIATPPKAARVFEPEKGLSEAFEAACDRYRRTYSALREIS